MWIFLKKQKKFSVYHLLEYTFYKNFIGYIIENSENMWTFIQTAWNYTNKILRLADTEFFLKHIYVDIIQAVSSENMTASKTFIFNNSLNFFTQT